MTKPRVRAHPKQNELKRPVIVSPELLKTEPVEFFNGSDLVEFYSEPFKPAVPETEWEAARPKKKRKSSKAN